MTVEEFELKQSRMSDSELINLCQKEVGELASTYGKSLTMTIPPSIKDTDMLLSELIKRFKMLSEALRWRDPEVELPKDSCEVIVKTDNGNYHVFYYWHEKGDFVYWDCPRTDVIAWRHIE